MVEDGACSFLKQSIRRFLRLLGVAVLAMIASAPLYALDVERKDYRITVPDGSTAIPKAQTSTSIISQRSTFRTRISS